METSAAPPAQAAGTPRPGATTYSRAETTLRASLTGLAAMLLLAALILIGSRMLDFFDPALTGYAIASLFAVFAIGFHYGTWLMRPSTRIMWRRSWQFFLSPANARRYFWVIPRTFLLNLLLQRFIRPRSRLRWIMHQCLFWGCILSFLVTFPLVFGWLHFESVGGVLYQIYIFGIPTVTIDALGPIGFNSFHALDYFAVLLLIGTSIAYWRRWQDRAVKPGQRVLFDLLPLHILTAVALTGLALTVVDFFFAGQGHWPITLTHQFLVIVLILYLPFGKLFHIIERPASLGVELYYAAGAGMGTMVCARCGRPFGMALQINDVKAALKGVGYDFWLPQEGHHWQDYCPRCKRVIRADAYAGLAGRDWVNPGGLRRPQYSLPTSPVPELAGPAASEIGDMLADPHSGPGGRPAAGA